MFPADAGARVSAISGHVEETSHCRISTTIYGGEYWRRACGLDSGILVDIVEAEMDGELRDVESVSDGNAVVQARSGQHPRLGDSYGST